MRSFSLALAALFSAACQTPPAVGARCERNAECGAPLVCRFGRCRTECTEQRDCPLGTACLLDETRAGSCALIDDPDCATPGHECASPLACVGHACVNVCALGPECPAGSACVPIGGGDTRARCVRVDGVDAGIELDAFVPTDAPRGDAGPLCTPMADPDAGTGPCDTALDIVVSDALSCVRTTQGRVWCWGTSRSIGRDGDTTGCTMISTDDWACPVPSLLQVENAAGRAEPASDVAELDVLDVNGCYVRRSDGAVACWGTIDYEAALGQASGTGERARIVTGVALPIFDHVRMADGAALAIAHDGTTWWGWGPDVHDVALRGTGMRVPGVIATPPAGVSFASVSVGAFHACGIDAAQHVVCWGANDHGQSDPASAGHGDVGPTIVTGGQSITHPTQIVAGITHTCVLADEGIVCWGEHDTIGDIGAAPACPGMFDPCPPTLVPTGSLDFDALYPARDSDTLCARNRADQHLYCWGAGYGGFGSAPTPVPGLPPVAYASSAWTHACAITTDSDVWCWGRNEAGELGRGTIDVTGTAIEVPDLVRFPR